MRTQDWLRLIILSAIWGGSFILFRILVPALGIFATADARVLIAGIALLTWLALIKRERINFQTDGKHVALVGALNSALPFVLYSYAALHIPAAYSAILNAVTPLFALVCGAIWLNESITPRRVLGLLIGIGGVALVANPWQRAAAFVPDASFLPAVLACLIATLCYALTGVYVKKQAAHVSSNVMAAGSQFSAGLILLPFALYAAPPLTAWTPQIIAAALALALVCSAVAYILYFRLLKDIGPSRSMTVTLLVPLFGMLWAALFLNELPTASMLMGCALILAGVVLTSKAA